MKPAVAKASTVGAVKASDFGAQAASSPDMAVSGFGDSAGYHIGLSREASGFAWTTIATIKPQDVDAASWVGSQCVSGDGKYVAVAVLPSSAVNSPIALDRGAFAYSVQVSTGKVTPLISGVGLDYYSPGCGVGDGAVFTLSLGENEQSTELVSTDLAAGKVTGTVEVAGQVTSAVPSGNGLVAVSGSTLVSLPSSAPAGTVTRPMTVTAVGGQPFSLRPSAGGGVDLLSVQPGGRSTALLHESLGKIMRRGAGPMDKVALFAGRAGHNIATGVPASAGSTSVRVVDASGLPAPPSAASADGDAVFSAAVTAAPVGKGTAVSAAQQAAASNPVAVAVATVTGKVLSRALPLNKVRAATAIAHTVPAGVTAQSQRAPILPAVKRPAATKAPKPAAAAKPSAPAKASPSPSPAVKPVPKAAPSSPGPSASAAPSPAPAAKVAAPSIQKEALLTPVVARMAGTVVAQTVTDTTGTATCAVPRLDANAQVMQPSNAQVDWATQMDEQGLLTGTSYTRPANFANMGLGAYAPGTDFPPVPLSHPGTSTQTTVPRSVMLGVLAQESNFDQASWHALPGIAGDPLIGDYYGAAGSIDSIDYPNADCGYGLAQVTTGMRAGDTTYSAAGQTKIAVDYQENIAAGLQILEQDWNQLYASGITANNADPKDLENWYFALWAYNSGVQPTAAFGNTTGCTPGPSCAGPDGTWGLGWSNNPRNPNYPPNRAPYLETTYADAATPYDWPYQERVLGWMASPIQRYGYYGYDQPTYNSSSNWVQIPPVTAMCTSANDCNPTDSAGNYCSLSDLECWWHSPVTWISNCSTTCATSSYEFGAGSTEPVYTDPHPPTCTLDPSVVPSGPGGAPIIVDDQSSPPANLVGCGGENWSSDGTFTYTPGTNAAGQATGEIDTHQLGAGFGGRILFNHTQPASATDQIDTGTWTPNLPKLENYTIKVHFPATGAAATDVVYTVNPGGGAAPWKFRVNQDWGSEQWATLATIAMAPGGNVTLTNTSNMTPGGYDVAYDAIAFIPMGGSPGVPIGGPVGVQDEPKGSNPAWVNCGCVQRTAGDPVNTATGYFGDSFTDLSTPGLGAPLAVARSYASAQADAAGPNGANAVNGPFGWGWSDNYGLSAHTDASGNVTISQEDGSQVPFTLSGTTYTASAPRFDATLTKNGSTYTYVRRGTQFFTFDVTTGRLTAETDLAGTTSSTPYWTTLAYDASGHLSTVTDPAGRTYTFTWTGTHITAVKDQTGREVDYAYDANNNLTDVYGVGSIRTSGSPDNSDHTQYTYTAAHLLASMRSPDNYGKTGTPAPVTSMVYDSSDRVTSQSTATGQTTTFTYGPNAAAGLAAGQTLTTDPAGHKTIDSYDANSLLTSETKGAGTAQAGTWTYTYDPVTLGISTTTDPDGNTSTNSYDQYGDKISSSDAEGNTTSALYDTAGHLLQSISPTGLETTTTYTAAGMPATTQQFQTSQGADGNQSGTTAPATVVHQSSYTYSDPAHPSEATTVKDPNGNTTTYTYDAFGEKTSTTTPAGEKTLMGYDTGRGQLTCTVAPSGTAKGVTPPCTSATATTGPLTPTSVQVGTSGWTAYPQLIAAGSLAAGGTPDLVTVDSSSGSYLWMYSSTGKLSPETAFNPRVNIGNGWSIYNMVLGTGDLNGDGHPDLVARDANGALWFYAGTGIAGSGAYKTRVQIGSGWNGFTHVIAAGDMNGDKEPDLLAIDSTGALWLYPMHTGTTPTFGTRVQVGSGWGGFSQVIAAGDINGDGHPDLIGVKSDGSTLFYAGTGGTSPMVKAGVAIPGLSYTATDKLLGFGDFDGDKIPDILDVRSNGSLWLTEGSSIRNTLTPPAAGAITYTRDIYGNTIATTDPLGHTTRATFDADGNQTSSTDANNRTSTTSYNAADQPVSSKAPDGTTTTTDYTPDGHVADTIDGAGHKTSYSYDGQGRQVTTTDPNNRTTTITYDPAGLETSLKTAKGVTTTYAYTPDGQETSATYSDSTPAVSNISYDPDGHELAMTDATGTSTLAYDSFGELLSHTNGAGDTVSYSYDANGNQTSITYPGQTTPVARTFTTDNQLATVTDFSGNKTTLAYTPDGQLGTISYPNGTTATNSFSTADTLTTQTLGNGASTLASLAYARDNANQVTAQTPTGLPGGVQAYSYTANEQLATSVSTGTTSNYGYDGAADATTLRSGTLAYDPANQPCWSTTTTVSSPSCTSVPSGATAYSYDADGNRTKTTPATGTASAYTYNGADELAAATTSTGSATYTYDGTGLRTSETVGATTTPFTWDDSPTPNLLSDGTHQFIYGPGGKLLEQLTGSTVNFLLTDALGSIRTITNAAGAMVASFTYDAFGILTAHTGTTTTPLGFTGAYQDLITGFDYLRNRYYDPTTATFTSTDPAYQKTGQRYAYTNNNPLNFTDATGLSWWNDPQFWETAGIIAVSVAIDVASAGLATPELAAADSVIIGSEVATATEYAESAAQAGRLSQQLAIDEGMSAGGRTIARGQGIRDIDRLTSQYGGEADDWSKMGATTSHEFPGLKGNYQAHWYENTRTGCQLEGKLKPPGE
ncbi:FG-GAP-like repeat-containing protein [Arthrobacter sp. STN4]|uniref:FG-GAP-like repeat-containing protein n=1 Tax=Arthrobacter sp. STN4 TaxID=2923276 RepID=UPI002119FB5B|nr:FG-GAP-like repeat-containing protein [Arthrobacter sp. STN4]MCQ9165548.1 FG-GAP-like repeat-containing protein [Arthrobacter sp. STN4]